MPAVACAALSGSRRASEASRSARNGAVPAEVGELEADARMALERARVHEVRDRAGRLERELEQPRGMQVAERLAVRRHPRVHERVRPAAVELGHERLQAGVAEIDARGVAVEDHPVERECVERVRELCHGGVDVGQRQQREAGEPGGRRLHDRRDGLVPRARDLVRPALVAEEGAGRAEGDHRRVDRVAGHVGLERLERRGHDERAGAVRGHEQLAVGVRDDVGVEIDPGHVVAR